MKVKKRLLLSLLWCASAVFAGKASDFTFTSNGSTVTYSTIDATTCAVKAGPTTVSAVVIPAQANGYIVTQVAANAFSQSAAMTSLTLPPTVTTIGQSAFSGASKLAAVYLGPNVSTIGASAFTGCTALKDIYITAQNAPKISTNTFPAYTATLHLQGNPTSYNSGTWGKFKSRTEMEIVDKVQMANGRNATKGNYIIATPGQTAKNGSNLFAGDAITFSTEYPNGTGDVQRVFWHTDSPDIVSVEANGKITLKKASDEPVTVIAETLYANGPKVEVTITSTLPYTSDGVTLYYKVLDEAAGTCLVAGSPADVTSAPIPETAVINGKQYTVTVVDGVTFMNRSGLTSVSIPNTVTTIGLRAFYGTSIQSVKLPVALKYLGVGAFQHTKLTSVDIPASVKTMRSHAFNDCPQLKTVTIGNSLKEIESHVFSNCGQLTSVVIPPSVTAIRDNAFLKCSKLASVYIGPAMKTIGASAFEGCDALTDIYITAPTAPALVYNTFSGYSAKLHLVSDARQSYSSADYWKRFAVDAELIPTPETMQAGNNWNYSVGNYRNLTPGQTDQVNSYMAPGKSQTYTVIKGSVTPAINNDNIERLFWYSADPAAVSVSDNGTITLNERINSPVKVYGESYFANGPKIEVTVYGSTPYTYEGATCYYRIVNRSKKQCWLSLVETEGMPAKVVIPEKAVIDGEEYKVTAIGENAFQSVKALKEVVIPSTVTQIRFHAFYYSGLTSVDIPQSVTVLGTGAFQGCSALVTAVLPNSLTNINTYVLGSCSNLTSVTIGNSLETLGHGTFANCTALTTVVVPPSVKTIGNQAFMGCKNLKSVYFGANVATLGNNLFQNSGVTDIYITAQSAPVAAAEAEPFSNITKSNINLHLQGSPSGYNSGIWSGFKNGAAITTPTSMSVGNDVNTVTVNLTSGKTATAQAVLTQGNSITYDVRQTLPATVDANIRNLFWHSDRTDSVFVDHNGKITLNMVLSSPVKVYGESFFANGPKLEVTVDGTSVTVGSLLYKITDQEKKLCKVTGAAGSLSGVVEIPSAVEINEEEYTVTAIGENAFASAAQVTKFVLPYTLEKIFDGAFHGCTGLTSMVIPNSVTDMGAGAFTGCTSLASVTLSNSLKTIGNSSFEGCSKLATVIVPPYVETVGSKAFYDCAALKSLYLGPNVKKIGSNLFNNATLTDLYITAQSVADVASDAFPVKTAKLHLQGTPAGFGSGTPWSGFAAGQAITPVETMQVGNGVNYTAGNYRTASTGGSTTGASEMYPGKTIKYEIKVFTPSSGLDTNIRKLFWRSANPSAVEVDAAGNITVRKELTSKVQVYGENYYSNGPKITVTIDGSGFPYTHEGVTLYYNVTDKTNKLCKVIDVEGTPEKVVIPEKVEHNGEEYTVAVIGDAAFQNRKELASVTFPATVTTINYHAFYGSGLTSVDIPSSVTTLSTGAFQGCDNLTAAIMPNSVKTTATHVFENCDNLKKVVISNSLKTINTSTFANCPLLETVVVPPSVTTIGKNAFAGCTSLKSIYLGPKVETINDDMFTNESMTDLYITAQTAPKAADGTSPFSKIDRSKVKLHLQGTPAGYSDELWGGFAKGAVITPIDTMKVGNGINYTKGNYRVAVPGQTVTAQSYIYQGNSVTYKIEEFVPVASQLDANIRNLFWWPEDPAAVEVDASGKITVKKELSKTVKVYGESYYADGPRIEVTVNGSAVAYTYEGVTLHYRITDSAKKLCQVISVEGNPKEVIIPQTAVLNDTEYTVTSIGEAAFQNRKELAFVSIPPTVTVINYNAFYYSGLKAIEIPNSVTTINVGAFQGCSNLTEVVIPNSVTSMGTHVFNNCTNLETVVLSNSLLTLNIEEFSSCPKLTSVIVPPSVTTIKRRAFANCANLTSLYLGPNVQTIENDLFTNESMTDLYITAQTAPKAADGTNPFSQINKANVSLHLQGTPSGYDSGIWSGFAAGEKMTVPEQIKVVNGISVVKGNELFAYTSPASGQKRVATTTYSLPAGGSVSYTATFTPADVEVRKLFWKSSDPANVFVDHNGTITLHNQIDKPVKVTGTTLYATAPEVEVTIIGAYPYTYEGMTLYYRIDDYESCSLVASDEDITYASIPPVALLDGDEYRVKGIGTNAFDSRRELTSVHIPNSVKSLGFRAFYNSGLTSVEIPTSVTTINVAAFQDCKDLTSITIPNSVTSPLNNTFRGCTSLESVSISNSIQRINNAAFYNCKSLKSIAIPPSVTVLDNQVFQGCSNLENIYLGPNVTQIGSTLFDKAGVHLYITAQTAPTVAADAFPTASSSTLHLQGNATKGYNAAPWTTFAKGADMGKPTRITVTMASAPAGVPARVKANASSGDRYNTAQKIYGLAGETHYRTATVEGSNLASDHVFWKSDDPEQVYVENDGTINIKQTPELWKHVDATAQSLYANTSEPKVEIHNLTVTSVESINDDDATDAVLDLDAPAEVYTVSGMFVGTSAVGLNAGVYVVRQGNHIFKILVK